VATLVKRGAPALGGVDRIIAALSEEHYNRLAVKAAKETLLEWQRSERPPGLMARFTRAGARFYHYRGYDRESIKHKKWRRDKQPYVRGGSLRAMLRKRKPKRVVVRGKAGAVLKIGGGALNFLSNVRPVEIRRMRVTRSIMVQPSPASPYSRTNDGGTHSVRGYSRDPYPLMVSGIEYQRTRAGHDHAEQFTDLDLDRRWLQTRFAVHFKKLLNKRAFTKTGKLRGGLFTEEGRRSLGLTS